MQEPARRPAGHGPLPSHRADAAGARVPPRHRQQHRGVRTLMVHTQWNLGRKTLENQHFPEIDKKNKDAQLVFAAYKQTWQVATWPLAFIALQHRHARLRCQHIDWRVRKV